MTQKQLESAICSILTILETMQQNILQLERKIDSISHSLTRQEIKELERQGKCLSF